METTKEWAASLPKWDGNDRFAELSEYIETDKTDFAESLKNWMFTTLAFNLAENSNNILMLHLHGEQAVGKTVFINWLFGERAVYYSDVRKDELYTTDALAVVVDDLDQLPKYDISGLKAFLTVDRIIARKPYTKEYKTFKRTAAFAATSNTVLTDRLENRAISVQIKNIDFNYKNNIDIAQLWAQVHSLI